MMKAFEDILITLLRMVAGVQLVIAGATLWLSLSLLAIGNFRLLPMLTREIIGMHCWLISFVAAGCGVLTWRFASEFVRGTNHLGRWLAGTIGLFWGLRAFVQFGFSVGSVWEMQPFHLLLFMTYGGIALTYLVVAGRAVKAN